jgi:hypothetical protein
MHSESWKERLRLLNTIIIEINPACLASLAYSCGRDDDDVFEENRMVNLHWLKMRS